MPNRHEHKTLSFPHTFSETILISNMSSSANFEAVVYENKGEEPLLQKPYNTMDRVVFTRFKTSSLLLGLIVGFFIQFSTLGANYLVISMWGEDVVQTSQRDIVIFSLLWSLFTSTMAIVILAFLRNLVSASYHGEDLEEMILHMECRFVVGALIGVCTAWAATDAFLGMSVQIVYSCVTLVVALSWCRLMMWLFAPPARRTTESPDTLMIV